jgi:sec-independent protein translocase protein TatB
MFDIGWTELLVLAVVAILIVGPKDLPRMLYAIGQTVGKMRRQADDFRRQFNESMREAGMDEVRNDMKKMSDLNPANQIRNEIESTFTDTPKTGAGKSGTGPTTEAGPNPKTGNGDKPTERDTGTALTSEGNPAERSQAASAPAASTPEATPDIAQTATRPPGSTANNPQPAQQDAPRGEASPAGNRNVNGAAEAKDAVS